MTGNLKPDPAHDVTGNGEWSHYELAQQLEMRGYVIEADTDDNEHSEVYFEGRHVGDIHGDNPATVTNVAAKLFQIEPQTSPVLSENQFASESEALESVEFLRELYPETDFVILEVSEPE